MTTTEPIITPRVIASPSSWIEGEANRALIAARLLDALGTVQWIGASPYRPHHKRRNWFVSIAAFTEPDTPTWNERELNIETLRASGPGGQHVNRTESAVRIIHRPTGLSVLAQEERSQHLNRRLALARLAALLAEHAEQQSRAAEDQRWRQHTQLERGNAVRVYRGAAWARDI